MYWVLLWKTFFNINYLLHKDAPSTSLAPNFTAGQAEVQQVTPGHVLQRELLSQHSNLHCHSTKRGMMCECVQKTTIQDQGSGGDYWYPFAPLFYLPVFSFPEAWCRYEKILSAVDWLFHCLFSWPVNLDRVAFLCEFVCMCNKILITIKHQLIIMQGSHIYMKLTVFSLVLTKNLLEICWLDFFKLRNTAKTVFFPQQ